MVTVASCSGAPADADAGADADADAAGSVVIAAVVWTGGPATGTPVGTPIGRDVGAGEDTVDEALGRRATASRTRSGWAGPALAATLTLMKAEVTTPRRMRRARTRGDLWGSDLCGLRLSCLVVHPMATPHVSNA